MMQRTNIPFWQLKDAVSAGKFEPLVKQSNTRSLCRADFDEESVYFVYNRDRGTIITVLTEDQAATWFAEEGGGHADDC